MSNERERRRLADALTLADGLEAPCEEDNDRLWAAASGELTPDALREVLAHIRQCGDCAEAYQLAVRAHQPDMPANVAVLEPELVPANRGRWLWPTVALVAALALALFLNKPEPTYRSDGSENAVQLLVPDGAALSDGTMLSWEPGVEGSRYAMLISTDALVPVVEVDGLTSAKYRVKAEKLSGLAPGAVLSWQVTAIAPDGTKRTSQRRTLVVE